MKPETLEAAVQDIMDLSTFEPEKGIFVLSFDHYERMLATYGGAENMDVIVKEARDRVR